MGRYSQSEITLAKARQKRDEFLSLLAQNVDPQQHRQQASLEEEQRLANTFRNVAEKWRGKRAFEVEPLTMEKNWLRLEKHLLSKIGEIPITSITPTLLFSFHSR